MASSGRCSAKLLSKKFTMRNIQSIEPDHGRATGIAVIVKRLGRREDEIAGVHA